MIIFLNAISLKCSKVVFSQRFVLDKQTIKSVLSLTLELEKRSINSFSGLTQDIIKEIIIYLEIRKSSFTWK